MLESEVDGRRLRREQNRQAVVEALAALFHEGNYLPGTAEVAERAGLSPRSLFRYFDDTDDLMRAAIDYLQTKAKPLLSITVSTDEPLLVRIEALVEARLRLWTAVAPGARVSRMRAPTNEVLAGELARTRRFLRAQAASLFERELEARPNALAAIDVLCSFESIELLLHDHGLSRRRTAAVLVDALVALLGPEGAP